MDSAYGLGRAFLKKLDSVHLAGLAFALILGASPAWATTSDLLDLSLEELMEVQITTVSKRPQRLAEAAAAVHVITHEDIRRSGATSIPEALRLAPGLHVARIDASRWAITARGFNSQFANKLLVLIDGRTAYTHLFSGVFWDVQDVALEDIDRIEVIRGPGGTLWGANAVNGVINIITRKAGDTQGWLASGGAGTIEGPFGTLRYGGRLGNDAQVRGYVKYLRPEDLETASGGEANDSWHMTRGGFRLDWNPSANDAITLQGDYYDGEADSLLRSMIQSSDEVSGGNILARLEHGFSDTSDLSLQVYYDRTERVINTIIGEDRDTVDIELEHRYALGSSHDMIWGLGYRLLRDTIEGSPAVSFSPDSRTDHLVSGFVQDQMRLLGDRLQFTIGSKFEHNDYTGFEVQPSVRALWNLRPRHGIWAAVSRAVRTPSRADHDVSAFATSPDFPSTLLRLTGTEDFDSEVLIAYEVGYRAQLLDALSLDLAAYYNDYDKLRSNRIGSVPLPTPPFAPGTIPVTYANNVDATGYGLEVGAKWNVTDYWSLSGWYTLMKLDVNLKADGSNALSENHEGTTPTDQVYFSSRLNLPWDFQFDTSLFYVGRLPYHDVDAYTRLDLRLGWRPTDSLEVSVAGQNLTERRHEEFGDGQFSVHSSVPRSIYGKVTLRY